MAHSPEVNRINALRDRGLFVRVIRRRPLDITLCLIDDLPDEAWEADPDEVRLERVQQTRRLYVRSELEAIRRIDEVQKATFAGKGGLTIVRVEDQDGGVVAEGAASCRADEAFSRKTGLMIALGRAEKDLALAGEQAAAVREVNSEELDRALAGEVAAGRA